jgi:hypothetical protein
MLTLRIEDVTFTSRAQDLPEKGAHRFDRWLPIVARIAVC